MESQFHPLVWQWFCNRFASPTTPQEAGWKRISEGHDTLIAAPTGSGKTLAAFLWSIDRLVRRSAKGRLKDKTSVVYISPLKALGNDIEKNLQEPLAEIIQLAKMQGLNPLEIRVAVRSGDTPSRERQRMVRQPPHILITTPESLYILLTARRSRQVLKTAETVIVDEIHAVAGDKRGAHLALSLERLDALAGHRLQRIGLSATQKPIEEIAHLLVGTCRVRSDGTPDCAIVDAGHRRELHLSIEAPGQELGPIASHELWGEVYDRIVAQVQAHRATLVFVNTRRLVERVSHQLTTRLGEGKVLAHHGSLSRKTRLEAEQKLKAAEIPVVVATASLELGIDIGHVDLVCHIGAPRALATLLQRVGRSGHWLGAVPKGILYPLTRDDLVQCAAAIWAVRSGELDRITMPEKALDVLAQQMVATVASLTPPRKTQENLPLTKGDSEPSGMGEDELWQLVRKAYPYRNLARKEFEKVIEMLSEGVARSRGRKSSYLHRDRIHGRLRARRGARLIAITNGGAIPDTADYDVIEAPRETFVGRVNEDFATESLAGDIFLLGNKSWRIRRVSAGKVWVEDAHGAPPTVPFWLGEAPGRTVELSKAVSDLRREVAARAHDVASAMSWLVEHTSVPEAGAEQIIAYIGETEAILGFVPTNERIVAERFLDEAGGMQLVLHAPLGGRINRAWGLALRKRFCAAFDFELQAAATDDGILLSLGERHSFPLASVFSYVHPSTVEGDLIQAALGAPIFTSRWRWNATRALAVQRHNRGRKIPMAIQRIRAEELLAAVFPQQVMCQDNRSGPVNPPDHPLINETVQNCLREAMDLDGLREILQRIKQGEISTGAVDTSMPSPMAHEILNANPYAFLDDAPLEERRARAVALRRTDPDLARGIGALSPEAIEEVQMQVWPDARDADELHDFLLGVGLLPLEGTEGWAGLADELIAESRAIIACFRPEKGAEERRGYVAAERLPLIQAAFPEMRIDPEIPTPALPHEGSTPPSADEAIREIVRGWMEVLGPTTASRLARRAGLSFEQAKHGLSSLEASGIVLQGQFNPGGVGETEVEWCERRLLARIHRQTLGCLRREIEPVSATDFIRFLLRWQHVQPKTQLHGRDGVLQVIGQLQGLELPAPAWEEQVLPARISQYDPADLESLCLAGAVTWGRLKPGAAATGGKEAGEPHSDAGGRLALVPKKARRQAPRGSRRLPLSLGKTY
ncbi:MAG: DEAD/DEAH box helicase [Candidatus Binatia bacterium]